MSVKEHEPPKKPLIYYCTVALVVLLLLNIFVFPLIFENQVEEVGYNDFLAMVDAGEVEEVARDDNAKTITFTAHNGKDGRLRYYQTGIWPDDTLLTRLESANVKFASSIPTQASPLLTILISWVLPILIFSFIGKLIMGRMTNGGAIGNAMSFGKANAKVYVEAQTGKTFADVAGEDEAKDALQEIVNFLHEPAKYAEIGAKLPKGALLVGPPGTGKTLLARAVAGEAKVPFFSISGSEFVEMFVGMGAAKVRDLFKQADEKAPCIVFIDEIDTIGKKRDSGFSSNDEREQTLNQLLVEMDGFAVNEGIIVIAATNRPDILDPALLRPGRFDRQITVNYPDVKGREAILKVHAKGKPLAREVSLEVLAKRTPGFTGADLENVLNEAAILAARYKKKEIGMTELEEAITRTVVGPEKRSHVITPEDKKITAYHEAGHAVVARVLPNCDPVHEISVIPRGRAAGYTMTMPEDDRDHMSRGKILDEIAMSLGGRVAESIFLDDICTGAYSDLQKATELARRMVVEFGMSDEIGPVFLGGQTEVFIAKDWGHQRNFSEEVAARVDKEIRRILEEQYDRAKTVLTEHRDAMERIVKALIEYEHIDGDDFEKLFKGEDVELETFSDRRARIEKADEEVLAKEKAEAEAKAAAEAQEQSADGEGKNK